MASRRVLDLFHPAVAEWFRASFDAPTPPQNKGWPAIAAGDSTLILAPTGSGKTLSAFLWCINRLMFEPLTDTKRRCRVVYISPLKALAVDIERNLRAPLAGIANRAAARGDALPRAGDFDQNRRYARGRTRAVHARTRRRPDHDTRIVLPPAHLQCARRPPLSRHGHRRRNPRARANQARRSPRVVSGAAGSAEGR